MDLDLLELINQPKKMNKVQGKVMDILWLIMIYYKLFDYLYYYKQELFINNFIRIYTNKSLFLINSFIMHW